MRYVWWCVPLGLMLLVGMALLPLHDATAHVLALARQTHLNPVTQSAPWRGQPGGTPSLRWFIHVTDLHLSVLEPERTLRWTRFLDEHLPVIQPFATIVSGDLVHAQDASGRSGQVRSTLTYIHTHIHTLLHALNSVCVFRRAIDNPTVFESVPWPVALTIPCDFTDFGRMDHVSSTVG
jgi:hypothetical protein